MADTAPAFSPVRVYSLGPAGMTLVDGSNRRKPDGSVGREDRDWDGAASREYAFQASYYQAMTQDDLDGVLKVARATGTPVVLEDLPEGMEIACPYCGREVRSREFMKFHVPRCPEQQ